MELLLRTPARRRLWVLLLLFGLLTPSPRGGAGIRRRRHGYATPGGGRRRRRHCADQHPDRRGPAGPRPTTRGRYAIPNVKAADYQLTAEKAGFQKQVDRQASLWKCSSSGPSTSCCRSVT